MMYRPITLSGLRKNRVIFYNDRGTITAFPHFKQME